MSSLPNFLVTTVAAINPSTDVISSKFEVQHINLTDYAQAQSKGLVLYFYPKDNTPGCSTQAQDFSAHLPQLHQLGYAVLGVSRDSITSHEKFIINQHINFALISDSDEQLCEHFGIIAEKKLYGKVSLGVVRSTLVFNTAGELIYQMRNVRAKGHVDKLLEILPTL